ncbi:imelysin family protein [Aestuariirhabdus sp. Z084]|uniref:imelysin family protein n=1 Tax=Aestuariirhabdus haliotis TaxID=2918751 RepID=UPI00201B4278|nr:imelysin family protein [Aestuariirhabdus haliotis]MCL6415165.1 imelysin family protein [Aestuariirhabdus haliotis]MCL6420040.1 imelysin family protein [Aestuariirhabdus haliotis]
MKGSVAEDGGLGWIRGLGWLCGSLFIFAPSLWAAELEHVQDQDWRQANVATVQQHVIPRYQGLSQQATALADSTHRFCAKPQKETLLVAQQAFHGTMDAWQGIQHIRFGPIETLMRNYSMQFWPDKKNHVGKRLGKLIKSQDVDALQGESFYQVPVSVRGLPALERLLFDGDAIAQMQLDPYRCQVAVRIADYVAEMGDDLIKEWRENMVTHFSQAGPGAGFFEDDRDAALALLKPLTEQLEVIRDLKLLRPMGSQQDKAKYKRLESWRSQRSLRNIQLNVAALEELYQGPSSSPSTDRSFRALLSGTNSAEVAKQFERVQHQLAQFETPIEQSIRTPAGYQQLSVVVQQLTELHDQLQKLMAANDIYMGFNSRDGD